MRALYHRARIPIYIGTYPSPNRERGVCQPIACAPGSDPCRTFAQGYLVNPATKLCKTLTWPVLVIGVLGLCGCAPRGAPWTIQCLELRGPQRREHIQQIAQTLKRTPGIKDSDSTCMLSMTMGELPEFSISIHLRMTGIRA